MKSKFLLTHLIPIAVIFCVVFLVFIVGRIIQESNNVFSNSSNEIAVVSEKKEQAESVIKHGNFGEPVRLIIPNAVVDAAFEYVGIDLDGAMEAPKDPTNVGWFKLGPRPGEKGSAVIAGHYGWKNGIPSAFDNLYKLRKGDRLSVEDDNGVVISFIVREIKRYDPDADAADVFGSEDGKAHLNLITCEGIWNKAFGSYSKRLVVFTDKE